MGGRWASCLSSVDQLFTLESSNPPPGEKLYTQRRKNPVEGPHTRILQSCQAAGGLQLLSYMRWPKSTALLGYLSFTIYLATVLLKCHQPPVKGLRTDRVWPKAGIFSSASTSSPWGHHGDLEALLQQRGARDRGGVFSPEPAPLGPWWEHTLGGSLCCLYYAWLLLQFAKACLCAQNFLDHWSKQWVTDWLQVLAHGERRKIRTEQWVPIMLSGFNLLLLTLEDAVIAFLALK